MSTAHRVLNTGRLPPALVERLQREYAYTDLAEDASALARGAEFDAVVTSAGIGIEAAQLAALPHVKVISSFGVGLDRLPLDEAKRRGIAVGYTPDVLNECVADTAIGLMLDAMRGFSAADRWVRRGEWAAGKPWPLARRVTGARLGIVGFGRIGQTIAQRAQGFGMAIRYHARRPIESVHEHEPSLIELARWCDVMIVIVAGGAGTRNLIDAAVLDALGPRGFLVNVARGSVIDEAALVQALKDRRIAGAGLDVFAHEPNVPNELFALDNVVLLPHVASATEETRAAMADRVAENLQAFFATGRLVSAAT